MKKEEEKEYDIFNMFNPFVFADKTPLEITMKSSGATISTSNENLTKG